MSEGRSATVAVLLYGDQLEPTSITAKLEVEPSHSWAKGQEWVTKSGSVVIRRTGLWSLEQDASATDVRSAIASLLTIFQAIEGRLCELPGVESARISLFIGANLSDGGVWEEFDIPFSIVDRCAALGLDLNVAVTASPVPMQDLPA